MTEVITFHGWGFSPHIWDGWMKALPDNVSVSHADRGYFGDEECPEFSDEPGFRVVMVHSFGLHWCPRELLDKADHLVIFSGFLSYHPHMPKQAKRSRMILRQMMSRFVEQPVEVLSDFYKNVCFPVPCTMNLPDPADMDHERLLEDLAELDGAEISPGRLAELPGVTLVHGGDDRIVSREKSRELFSLLTPKARYLEVMEAGHAVGFTNTDECLKFLTPMLHLNED